MRLFTSDEYRKSPAKAAWLLTCITKHLSDDYNVDVKQERRRTPHNDEKIAYIASGIKNLGEVSINKGLKLFNDGVLDDEPTAYARFPKALFRATYASSEQVERIIKEKLPDEYKRYQEFVQKLEHGQLQNQENSEAAELKPSTLVHPHITINLLNALAPEDRAAVTGGDKVAGDKFANAAQWVQGIHDQQQAAKSAATKGREI